MNRELKENERARLNFFGAVEKGIIELDDAAAARAQSLKSAREALLLERARLVREHNQPIKQIKANEVERFGKVLREKLMVWESPFAKSYLKLLVDQITITGKQATLTGSKAAILEAMGKSSTGTVPSSMGKWRTLSDSNARPPDS